ERFLASGATVSLWDRDRELATSTGAALSTGGIVHAKRADVSVASDVEAATTATVEAMGGIDILVTSAGITGPNAKAWEYPIDAWRQVMDVNLTGTFLCCRAVVPVMIRQNYGR